MPPNRANVFDDESTRAILRVVKEHLSSIQPRPEGGRKRRNGGAPSGDGDSGVAVITETVTAAESMTFLALPSDVRSQAGEVDDATVCLKLGKGKAKIAKLYLGEDEFLYAVPDDGDGMEEFDIFSTSTGSSISVDSYVQFKTVDGQRLIDVAPC